YSALIPGFHNPPPFLVFLRRNWYDILTQFLCVTTAALLYYFCPPVTPRYFPLYRGVEQSAWGLKHGHPYIKEYVTTIVSAVVSFAIPAAIMGAIALWGTRSFEDGNAALIGLGYALSTSTLFQVFIKVFIGGLRPHFLTVCAPPIPPAIPPSVLGLQTLPGSGIIFYTASQVCRGKASHVREAQMSFPSGHACAAFAGFGFLALWLNAKFKVLSRGGHFRDYYGNAESGDGGTGQEVAGQRVHHWKLLLFMTPWCIAVILAASKVRDMWHHPVDVVFGSLVGALFAHLGYKLAYRNIYDWRTNHIPL
ncbi:phosphatidic acid phosphatase type 2/haloperoxidase, partial [Phaeosphaeriaceae sp. PMI808]